MTNEEAKQLYFDAVRAFEEHNYHGALGLFDKLDAERPNSRHVTLHRAKCMVHLKRLDEAEACRDKLAGKLEDDQLKELDAMILAARKNAKPAAAPAPGSAAQSPAAPQSPSVDEDTNVFNIEAVYPATTEECTVTGVVSQGVFRTGDELSLVSPEGLPLLAPILRIGTAETPLNLVKEGQKAVMLLKVEPHHVVPGSIATCEDQEESYAATMVVGASAPGSDNANDGPSPIVADVERLLRQREYDKAKNTCEARLAEASNDRDAHRLLARVYLEAPEPLHDPKKGLESIRRAFESGGAEDHAVVFTLAQALGQNNEAEHGLRFLERLYKTTTAIEAKTALAVRVSEYRRDRSLGHVWELADNAGDILFETTHLDEAVKAVVNGTVPRDGLCRRDRVGEWRPIETTLGAESPEVAKRYAKPEKAGSANKAMYIAIAVVGVIAVVAVLLTIL